MLTDHLRNRTNLRTGAGMASNPWLFPGGRNAGKHLDPQTMQMRLHNRGISVLGARNSCRTSWPKYLLPLWPTYWAIATPAAGTTHNWRLSPGRATFVDAHRLELGLGDRGVHDLRAGGLRQFEVAGQEVGVEVGLDDEFDGQTEFLGRRRCTRPRRAAGRQRLRGR